MDSLLVIFLTATALSLVINVFFKKYDIPTIIGYIIAGAFITHFFGLHGSEKLSKIAEFGIVFLMFTIGLEFSIRHLMSMKKEVFLNGTLQVLLTGSMATLVAHYIFDMDHKSAIILGFAISLSSTAIVLKTLNENHDINTRYGRRSLGILLFQDIAVIPLLLMIDFFANSSSSLTSLLTKTFVGAIVVLVLLYLIGKYLLNRVMYYIAASDSEENFIIMILFLVVGSSYLAHFFGFSYSLGAFLAGMMISETKYKHQIEADLIPFRDILLGLFFISVGMQIDFTIIINHWLLVLVLVVGIMALKTAVIFAILRFSCNTRVSFKTAVTLSQIGEFALALFELARVNSLIDDGVTHTIILVVILTMFITPFILKNIKSIADSVISVKRDDDDFKIQSTGIKNHIVILGYGALGQEVVYNLKKQNLQYIVIERDINLVALGESRGENVFFGNATERSILEFANVKTSAAVIVTMENERHLMLVCEAIKSFEKNLNMIVRVANEQQQKVLKDLHVSNIINGRYEVAKLIIDEALRCNLQKN